MGRSKDEMVKLLLEMERQRKRDAFDRAVSELANSKREGEYEARKEQSGFFDKVVYHGKVTTAAVVGAAVAVVTVFVAGAAMASPSAEDRNDIEQYAKFKANQQPGPRRGIA